MTTNSEINRIITQANARKQFWGPRNKAISEIWRILEMVDEHKLEGFESTVIPELRIAAEFGTHILSANPVRHRMPLRFHDAENETEKDRKGKGERALHGIWRLLDTKRRRAMLDSFQRSLSWWGLGSGHLAVWAEVTANADGSPEFFADIWDISEVYPEAGGTRDGLLAVDREYSTTLEEFRRRADANGWDTGGLSGDGTQKITVTDHWESRRNRQNPYAPDILNAVIVTAKGLDKTNPSAITMPAGALYVPKPLTRAEHLDHIPVFIYPVNAMATPAAYYNSAQDMSVRWGQSFLETAKITYDTINRLYQYILTDVKRAASSVFVDKNMAGDITIEAKDLLKMVNVIARRPNENLEKLDQTTAIGSAQIVLDDLGQRLQRSSMAFTAFGQAPFTLSGVAIERLNEQTKAVLGPTLSGMKQMYGDVDFFFLSQYKKLTEAGVITKPLKVAGRIRGEGTSGYFDEEFKVEDVPSTYWVDVSITPSLPLDMQIKASTAAMLRPGEKQVSRIWMLENILEVEDPVALDRATMGEMVDDLPAVRIGKAILDAMDKAEAARARGGEDGKRMEQVYLSVAESLTESLAQLSAGPGQQTNQGNPSIIGPQGAQPSGNGRTSTANVGGRPATGG